MIHILPMYGNENEVRRAGQKYSTSIGIPHVQCVELYSCSTGTSRSLVKKKKRKKKNKVRAIKQ